MALRVADFFCGCGGTSKGLELAGLEVALGLDFDLDSSKTYKSNFPAAKFIQRDIKEVTCLEVASALNLQRDDILVFCGCAPCQPFSKIKTHKKLDDTRVGLLTHFGRFVKHFHPEYVVVENVPGIQSTQSDQGPLKEFLVLLEAEGYSSSCIRTEVVECQFYGVPQRRRRLVLIASKTGESAPWPVRTHGPENLPVVWDFISSLPEIGAGETHPDIPDHQSMRLSPTNLRRLKATPSEKGREAWPEELVLACHKGRQGHTDVYGRLRKHALASAMTTKCISLSNGRFGHPEQHRALTVREAALLQTFPMDFEFRGSLISKARQIGNAVPVELAKAIGIAITTHHAEQRERQIGEV
jgi:DNA (cytosine-5)-methyltransferase 1